MAETGSPESMTNFLEVQAAQPDAMAERIARNIESLDRGSLIRIVRFKLPYDVHELPVYEHRLHERLVSYHNERATLDSFVHPFTFMMLDPEISSYVPRLNGKGRLRMESASEHELRHWLELAESGVEETDLHHALYWDHSPDATMKALTLGVLLRMPGEAAVPPAVAAVPNYPSGDDFDVAAYRPKEDGFLSRALDAGRSFMMQRAKAHEQGIGWWRKPIDLEFATMLIYPQWRERNQDRIRMDVYDQLAGYGSPQTR